MNIRVLFLFSILVFFQNNNVKAQQDPVDLYVGNDFGMQGDTVSIDVKVNEFTDIISFQASLNWDPVLLKYVGVSDFGIKDFGENSFGTTNANQGHLRFLWEPGDASPLTVNDSTVLFSAQFEIMTNTSQEIPIGFTDIISNPAYPIEFANSNYTILTVNTFEGNITYMDRITGLEDLSDIEINIYPNPFHDFIRVSNRDGLLEFIKIFDLNGALISENYNMKNRFIDIYLSGSSNGVYLVKISKDGKMLSRKVVKNLSK